MARTGNPSIRARGHLKLELLTGARCGEISGLCAEEIDLDHWTWTLPAARSLAAGAQQSGKVPRIGYLSPAGAMPRDEAFRHRLQELGYVDGKNIIIEYRFADGKFDRLRALAEELVRLEVDVIVTAVTQASLAAKHADQNYPYRLRCSFRSAGDRAGRKPGAARRQCHWNRCYERRCCGKIA